MEQELVIIHIQKSEGTDSQNYNYEKRKYPLAQLKEGAEISICEPSSHLDRKLGVVELTDEKLVFDFSGERYSLNRIWQVLGTPSHIIPEANTSFSHRFIFYFATEKKCEESQFNQFQKLYKQMCTNEQEGEYWKNIPLARQALHLMKDSAPETDKETSIELCELVINETLLLETDTPRLILSFMDFWHTLNPNTNKWKRKRERLLRMTDPKVGEKEKLELITKKRSLRYDPVQLSEKWEDNIYEVEKELHELFKDEKRHRGFCFSYWSAKGAALAKRGIAWRSPQTMNPRTRFD